LREASLNRPHLGLAIILSAMAGGMGWGIRGQYGHQTGAMIAGVLVGLVWMLLFGQRLTALSAARVVACVTLGVSVGGSMTYGQTVGLTHDPALVGNWQALGWGLLGLFLKGGIWIGLAGLFLGMSLGRIRYDAAEWAGLIASAIFLRFLGIALLNEPYLPDEKMLPTIYFSDDWIWEPNADLKPRRELWGGLLVAWLALTAYVRSVRGDILALRLSLIGFVSGGLGFSLGQCIQATHAWNREWFANGPLAHISPYINWWNMMEITFGAIFAGGLAIGLWVLYDWLRDDYVTANAPHAGFTLSPLQEGLLALVHVAAVVVWSFGSNTGFGAFAGMGYPMILIPLLAVCSGRVWPYLFIFPVVLIPIAGKTLKRLCYESEQFSVPSGWLMFVVGPLLLSLLATLIFSCRAEERSAIRFASWALPGVAWIYFGLNYAFFELPWPWLEWTARTPSGLIFTVCVVSLTLASIVVGRAASPSGPNPGQNVKR
jgi:hypothetical protein